MKQLFSNIYPEPGTHIAGICSINIAPKEWLSEELIPNFLLHTIAAPITLKPGREFIKLKMVESTYSFTEKVKSADAGQYYDIEISGELNTFNPEIYQTLLTLKNYKFIAIVTDAKSKKRIVGNLYSGLQLMFGTSNVNNNGGELRISISLTMQSPEPAIYLV